MKRAEAILYFGRHGAGGLRHAVRRTIAPIALVLAVVGVLLGAPPAVAGPDARGSVVLTFDSNGMTLAANEVRAGVVTFTLRAPDLDVGSATMFRLRGSSTLDDVRLDWQHEFSDDQAIAALATRDLSRHAVFVGLAQVTKGRMVSATQPLTPGVYYIQDSQDAVEGTRHMIRLRVSGNGPEQPSRALVAQPLIAFTPGNRIEVRGALPATGTVTRGTGPGRSSR